MVVILGGLEHRCGAIVCTACALSASAQKWGNSCRWVGRVGTCELEENGVLGSSSVPHFSVNVNIKDAKVVQAQTKPNSYVNRTGRHIVPFLQEELLAIPLC